MAAHPRRILVGYSGSEAARRALETAADLAGYGSTLAVVSVAAADVDEALQADSVSGAGRLLSEAHEQLLRRQVTARYLQPVGEPADRLLEAARELDADLLVVGRRDRNAPRRLVLGSVSAKVVRRCPCDVLVVR